MDTAKELPSFNLKVVIQETGIKPYTLRAWERRYGLPQPHRTAGGHRLYSQHDIDIVKWLLQRQEEGLSISRAVELWFNLQAEGQDPLSDLSKPEPLPAITDKRAELSSLRQEWIEHCLKFDEPAAENVLTQAFALFPIKTVCLEILQKGLAHMGDLWFENKATPHQEHFTSAFTIKRIITLIAAAPEPTRVGRLLVSCPPKEEHTISLLMLTLLLRHRGWEVVYFGANTPLFRFESVLKNIKPDLIVMAAQRLPTAASLLEVAQYLQKQGANFAYGGRIFNLIPTLRKRIPGHYLGDDIESALATISQIITFNPSIAPLPPLSEEYQIAATAYRRKRPLIETEIWQLSSSHEMPHDLMESTNIRLSESITAALKLGELSLLDTEFGLDRQLIKNYGIPLDWQCHYFDAYYRAANKHLRRDGSLIIDWLSKTKTAYCLA